MELDLALSCTTHLLESKSSIEINYGAWANLDRHQLTKLLINLNFLKYFNRKVQLILCSLE